MQRRVVDQWAPPSVLSIMADLFGEHFDGSSWDAWRAFLAALFALPMTEAQVELFRQCTGREQPPVAPSREGWMVVGRRGGKSRIAALLAVYLACCREYPLALGERGIVMVVAVDRRQAKVVLEFVRALLESHPFTRALIKGDPRKESIDLTNNISIEIVTASFRSIRGRTVVAAILDEIAFWNSDVDAANPDSEILSALRPAMATIPDALLLALSSPYARRGELWNAYAKHFGKEGDPILVWRASTMVMHADPRLQPVIDAAYEADESSASAEYGAEFRKDIESFIDEATLERLVVQGRQYLPPQAGMRYVAFADPAGGSGGDSFTLGIAHLNAKGRGILDLLLERRSPFSPEQVVTEFSTVLQQYGVYKVTSDRYAGDWPVESWRKHGITCEPSERSKSEIYSDFLPLLNSGHVELVDSRRLVQQLSNLERRTARSGKDSIDHVPGGHDDVANSAAGVLVLCTLTPPQQPAGLIALSGW
jgi:hypothetical protein